MFKKKAWWTSIALLATLALILVPAASHAQPKITTAADGVVVAEGLNTPQGVLVDPDGNVWVIDSGVGGETEVQAVSTETGEPITAYVGDTARVVMIGPDGAQTEAALLPSILIGQEAVGGGRLALADGTLFATNGVWTNVAGEEATPLMSSVVKVSAGGEVTEVANTWPIERDENPDGTDVFETHPYGVAAGPDGMLYVADAGANTVLKVDPATGEVSLLAVIPPVKGAFPSPSYGGELLADPVPTGIVVDDEGNVFVSLLTGAPFLPGNAKVVKITPDGEMSDYATGLTMLTDLRKGPDGEMYAVQFVLLTDQGPKPDSGGVFKIVEGDSRSELVIQGLSFPTSVDFNAEGDAYVAVNGGFVPPGTGAVLEFASLVTPMAPMESEAEAAVEAAVEAEAEEMAADSVTVSDQESNGEQVTVDSVTAAENGWMVIHADDGGKPGPVLGKAAVPAGTTENVIIMLDEALEGEATVWAMLHVDAGVLAEYEFPGPDGPVKIDDAVVMAP
ncbi:MAG: ScyD/ScyE family protein [Caldilineaceae bacterium]|nr:ScyD/ScyE family protein [Caldilineaceae bacterium]